MNSILSSYKKIEQDIPVEYFSNKVTYDAPVNFNESLSQPRHRWYPYKEGFSPSFVRSFFNRYVDQGTVNVLDPFSGVGTTVLEACLSGHQGVGIEVNPLAAFIADTKTINLNATETEKFDRVLHKFEKSELSVAAEVPQNKTVISYFENEVLTALLRIKQFILEIENKKLRDLFFSEYPVACYEGSEH